ncbi:hypothetical protein FI667_g13518, partial [Globisporangium splendens]
MKASGVSDHVEWGVHLHCNTSSHDDLLAPEILANDAPYLTASDVDSLCHSTSVITAGPQHHATKYQKLQQSGGGGVDNSIGLSQVVVSSVMGTASVAHAELPRPRVGARI